MHPGWLGVPIDNRDQHRFSKSEGLLDCPVLRTLIWLESQLAVMLGTFWSRIALAMPLPAH